MSKLSKKDLSIEIMRIIAAFFVIFNHGDGFILYQQFETGSIKFYSYVFVSVFCKFAVPLFFMISGALLLGREEPVKVVLKKRVLKSVIVLFVFSIIYYVYSLFTGRFAYTGWSNILDFFGKFLSCGIWGHLWFMYSYIVFLLALPFFRMIIKSMDKNTITYFCIIACAFIVVVPIVQYLLFWGKYEIYISFSLFTMKNIAAPFIGYWLYAKLDYDRIKNKHILILWLINIGSLVLTCLLTHATILNIGTNSGYDAEEFFYTFATSNAAVIFITVRKYCRRNFGEKISAFISAIGGTTFGVFLFHYMMFSVLPWFYYSAAVLSMIGAPMTGWLVAAGIYFVVNFFIVFILKKIPVIRDYL